MKRHLERDRSLPPFCTRRKMASQYSCLGNPMDQRSLAGNSPWGHTTQSDKTERLNSSMNQEKGHILFLSGWALGGITPFAFPRGCPPACEPWLLGHGSLPHEQRRKEQHHGLKFSPCRALSPTSDHTADRILVPFLCLPPTALRVHWRLYVVRFGTEAKASLFSISQTPYTKLLFSGG